MRSLPILAVLVPLSAAAQAPEPRGPIQDNSFLVEEAYNQEAGVVQHISTLERSRGGGWAYGFTQEWPLAGLRHQASYTVPIEDAGGGSGIGDVALHYRYQLVGDGGARLAVAPRATVILPTGDASRSRGAGGVGVQGNLPISLVLAERLVAHTNVGATWLPAAQNAVGAEAATTSLSAAQSVVWLVHPAVNLLVEVAWSRDEEVAGPESTLRSDALTVSPGVRFAIDLPSGLQIVPGIAVPLGIGPSDGERAVFVYLSLEHAFRRQ
jgi:Putative MetA-pathway of phenol degradation